MPNLKENYNLLNTGDMSINAWADAQTDERWLTAMNRAAKACGLDYIPEDKSQIMHDDWIAALQLELKKMAGDDLLRGMADKGLVTASVTEDGQLGYTLTEKGEAYGLYYESAH